MGRYAGTGPSRDPGVGGISLPGSPSGEPPPPQSAQLHRAIEATASVSAVPAEQPPHRPARDDWDREAAAGAAEGGRMDDVALLERGLPGLRPSHCEHMSSHRFRTELIEAMRAAGGGRAADVVAASETTLPDEARQRAASASRGEAPDTDTPPRSDDVDGLCKEWYDTAGQSLGHWTRERRRLTADRLAATEMPSDITTAVARVDDHVADCRLCKASALDRPWHEPGDPSCPWVLAENPTATAAHAALAKVAGQGTSGSTAMAMPPHKAAAGFSFTADAIAAHGLTINESKSQAPAAELVRTGLLLRAEDKAIRLPAAKRTLVEKLSMLLPHAAAGMEEWRTICGKLRSMAPALGRRLGPLMFGLWGGLAGHPGHPVTLSQPGALAPEAEFSLRQVSAMLGEEAPPAVTGQPALAVTDASESGAGAVIAIGDEPTEQHAWALGEPHNGGRTSSTEREILAILGAIQAAASSKSRQPGPMTLTVVTDSLGAAACINHARGRSYGTARATAATLKAAFDENIEVVAVRAPRLLTKRADLLSRVHETSPERFRDARRHVESLESDIVAMGFPPRREAGTTGDEHAERASEEAQDSVEGSADPARC